MSRKIVIAIVVLFVVAVLGAIGAVGAYYGYNAYSTQKEFERAERHFENSLWGPAKGAYARYMARIKDYPPEILEKYATASLNILSNRSQAIQDAGNAYFQLARDYPENTDYVDRIIGFYKHHEAWSDLEYAAEFLSEQVDDANRLAELRFLEALAADRQGRPGDARDRYEAIIEDGNARPEVFANLAAILREQGLEEQAAVVIEQMREAYPDDAAAKVAEARYYLENENTAAASDAADKALALAPDDGDVLTVNAQVKLAQDQPREALPFLDKVLAQEPEDFVPYRLTVTAYAMSEQPEQAIAFLNSLDMETLTDSQTLYPALAELYIQTEQFDQALEAIEAYGKAFPDDRVIVPFLEARTELARGNSEEALTQLTTLAESYPEFAPAQLYQSIALLETGNLGRARVVLEGYLANVPDDLFAQGIWQQSFGDPQTRAQMLESVERVREDMEATANELVATAASLLRDAAEPDLVVVEELLEKAIAKAPEEPAAYTLLAAVHTASGNTAQAKSVVERAMAAGIAEDAMLRVSAANAIEEGDLAEAKQILDGDLAREDITAEEVISWARLFAERGQLDTALEVLDEKSQMDPPALAAASVILLTEMGDTDAALAMLEEAERVLPDAAEIAEAKVSLARTMLAAGEQSEKARQMLMESAQTSGAAAAARLGQVQAYLSEDPPNIDAAATLLEMALEEEPDNVEALLIAQEVAAQRGQLDKALTYVQRAVRAAPRLLLARLAEAELQLRLGRGVEAEETLNVVLGIQPDLVDAQLLLARAFVVQGRQARAQEKIDALSGRELTEQQQANLAGVRELLKFASADDSEREELLRAQLVESPEDAGVVRNLVAMLLEQGRRDEAIALLEEAVDTQEGSAELWTMLGNMRAAGDAPSAAAEAVQAYAHAIDERPDYAPALLCMAEVQLAMGNAGSAQAFIDRYLQIQPEDAEALNTKAAIIARTGMRTQEGLRAVNAALAISERPEFFLTRGLLNMQDGAYRDALADFRRFADTQAQTPADIELQMAQAYAELGDTESAGLFLRRARAQADDGASLNRELLAELEQRLSAGETP